MKRLQAASTLNQKNRLPITPELLKQTRHQWENKAQDYEVITRWAVCRTAFFGSSGWARFFSRQAVHTIAIFTLVLVMLL